MVWSKKGLADSLLWFFIFVLAGFSVLVFVVTPQSWLEESVNPVVLGAGDLRELVFERLTAHEFPYGDISSGREIKLVPLETIGSESLLSMSDNRMSCKVTISEGGAVLKVLYCGGERGEELFKHANALPYEYRWSSDTREFVSSLYLGREFLVKVDIVVAKRGYYG